MATPIPRRCCGGVGACGAPDAAAVPRIRAVVAVREQPRRLGRRLRVPVASGVASVGVAMQGCPAERSPNEASEEAEDWRLRGISEVEWRRGLQKLVEKGVYEGQ